MRYTSILLFLPSIISTKLKYYFLFLHLYFHYNYSENIVAILVVRFQKTRLDPTFQSKIDKIPLKQSVILPRSHYPINKKNSFCPDAPGAFYASEEQGTWDVNSSSGEEASYPVQPGGELTVQKAQGVTIFTGCNPKGPDATKFTQRIPLYYY